MLDVGEHCIKTWSATQWAYALNTAEAELYGMVDGVTRANGLRVLTEEVGFVGLSKVVKLGTDSAAAKSFVNRRGLGKIWHLQIRDLWRQQEVADGKLEVVKVKTDLMTKVLTLREVEDTLKLMGLLLEEVWGRRIRTDQIRRGRHRR